MKTKAIIFTAVLAAMIGVGQFIGTENYYHPGFHENQNSNGTAYAYPPGVGITSTAVNCLVCHVDNGPWKDDGNTIVDIVDKTTGKSLKQPDGSFVIEVKRNTAKTVLTVLGRAKGDNTESPYRNAWTYIDTSRIRTGSLSKFASGWECNLPLSCRVVGDKLEIYEGAKITSLPMTLRPTDSARNCEIQLQLMLTKGESVKGKAELGMLGNYYMKKVVLRVIE
ncbi:MAG: hypothetical protein HYY40_00830 [Bacteroidetes bacterium]|nr:hypothetical protein [Bacteroidota bacterium]